MDKLMGYHSLDIQWGNHDIIWMAAAAGSLVCLAIILRISLRYKNLATLEDGYGISLLPLAIFAMQTYDLPPKTFGAGKSSEREFSEWENELYAKMEKAIAIIQFKLEGQIISRHPEYHMEDRRFLQTIDLQKGTVCIGGHTYSLIDKDFPTLEGEDPYALTKEEKAVIDCLARNVKNSVKLQSHAKFLFDKGSMYLVYNEQVLFHGCIPFTKEGELASFVDEKGGRYAGKCLLDYFHKVVQDCYPARAEDEDQKKSLDALWYLWCGKLSPLFGKERMTTFERYFIEDKESHKEGKNAYFTLREHEHVAYSLIREFNANPERAHIVNGHVPVKANKGEQPVKAGGKVITIDGGFSRAYQKVTGIAGYTLIYNSYGLLLATHNGFCYGDTIAENDDMQTDTQILESQKGRVLIETTDIGRKLAKDVENLRLLLRAYNCGLIEENRAI
ncbi:UNVERIFIED_CONTAM: hypothetical protein PYX00_010985 [Menopon gallinae]|uniref:Fructose-bisphosphatase n=1 Tax=Menopon gallinae TaxID=328185 RepID=A0AAW2H779_9NEOP